VEEADSSDGTFSLDLGDSVKVRVEAFAGRKGIDIRRWYTDRESKELMPGKGVRLSEEDWAALKERATEVDKKMAENSESSFEVIDLFFATAKDGRIDLRKFYVDKADGEKKPSKKGISLSKEQWDQLKSNFSCCDKAIQESPVQTSSGDKSKKKEPKKKAQPSPKKENKEKKEKSHSKLEKAVEKLLEGKDLETVTIRTFRQELEKELGLDDGSLEERKGEIKDLLSKAIKSRLEGQEDQDDE
jgi:hypothetical protein